jgi:GntR family transcriptional regulator/MocR family aminotransferase
LKLVIGRNTLIAVYDQLIAEGYLVSKIGSGTRVSNSVRELQSKQKAKKSGNTPKLSVRGIKMSSTSRSSFTGVQTSFQAGLPALDEFPYAQWSRYVTRHYRSGAKALFG